MDFFTVKQVADKLQLSPQTIKRHISNGKMGAVKMGGVWRISDNQLNEYVSANLSTMDQQTDNTTIPTMPTPTHSDSSTKALQAVRIPDIFT
jgi:excisionase family DNA binding protein